MGRNLVSGQEKGCAWPESRTEEVNEEPDGLKPAPAVEEKGESLRHVVQRIDRLQDSVDKIMWILSKARLESLDHGHLAPLHTTTSPRRSRTKATRAGPEIDDHRYGAAPLSSAADDHRYHASRTQPSRAHRGSLWYNAGNHPARRRPQGAAYAAASPANGHEEAALLQGHMHRQGGHGSRWRPRPSTAETSARQALGPLDVVNLRSKHRQRHLAQSLSALSSNRCGTVLK